MDELDRTPGAHLDALARFLRIATDNPLISPVPALAEALGKTLFPSDVVVRWRIYRERRTLEDLAFQWNYADHAVKELEQTELAELSWTAARPTATYKLEQAFSNNLQGIRITKDGDIRDTQTELEVIFIRADSSFPSERIERFRRNVVGITIIFQAFSSLAASRLSLPQRTNRDDFRDRLTDASADLDRLGAFPGTGGLQEQVVEAVILEMFGRGWDVHNLSGEKGGDALSSFEKRIKNAETPKLRAFHSILAASHGVKPTAKRQFSPGPGSELQLLEPIARWTYLHARAPRGLETRSFTEELVHP